MSFSPAGSCSDNVSSLWMTFRLWSGCAEHVSCWIFLHNESFLGLWNLSVWWDPPTSLSVSQSTSGAAQPAYAKMIWSCVQTVVSLSGAGLPPWGNSEQLNLVKVNNWSWALAEACLTTETHVPSHVEQCCIAGGLSDCRETKLNSVRWTKKLLKRCLCIIKNIKA